MSSEGKMDDITDLVTDFTALIILIDLDSQLLPTITKGAFEIENVEENEL